MTTLRQAHKKKYTCIDNKLAQNNELSLRSRGMMLYLLSLPDNWEIHLNHLCKVMKEGKKAIGAILAELKAAGYIHHHKMGFKEGWQYFVFELPITDNDFKEFLRTSPFLEKFQKANNSQKETLQSNKEKEIKNTNNTPISPKRGLRSLRFENRKKWAYANQNNSPCGSSVALEDRYVINSGGAPPEIHWYAKRDPFWDKLNL